MGSATKQLAVNTIGNLIQQIVYMVKGFIVPLVILKVYGSEINGLVLSVNQFVSYFLLIEAGLSPVVVLSLYSPLVASDYVKINVILSTARRIYNKIGLWFLVLIFAGAFIYPFIIHSDNFEYIFVVTVFLLTGIGISLELFTLRRYSALLQADNSAYVIHFTLCGHAVIQCVATVIFAFSGFSILWILAVTAASYLLRSAILTFVCRKRYVFMDLSKPSDKSLLPMRNSAFVHQICNSVSGGAPFVIASVLLPLTKVSVLSLYLLVIDAITRIINSTGSATQLWGRFWANKENERFLRSYAHFESMYILCVTVFVTITTLSIGPFINVYTRSLSDRLEYDISALAILCAVHLLFARLSDNQVRLIGAVGLFDKTMKQMITSTIILIVASSILGTYFGIVGIIIGSILSNIYKCGYLLFYVPRQCGLRTYDTAKRWITSGICVSTLSLFFPYIIHFSSNGGYKEWFFMAIVATLISIPIILVGFITAEPKLYMEIWSIRIVPIVRKLIERN